MNINYNIIN